MSHLLRWGGVLLDSPILARLTKYTGLVIFAIVIISVIALNIIASYSNSKITAGAESPVTLATNVTGEASISLSIHSATDSCDTSASANPAADVCLQIPDGGGIAVGRHTISVISNSYAGYSVTVEGSGGDSTDMVASDFGSGDGASSNNERIRSTSATIDDPATLALNTWGIAIPGMGKYNNESDYASALTTAKFGAVPTKQNGAVVMSSTQATGADHDGTASDDQIIYYGANVEQLFRAGTYSEEVVYTATVKIPSNPTITSVSPNQYELGSNGNSTVTIEGTNLASAYRVWIDINDNHSYDVSEECTNLNVTSDSQLTCNVPTDQTIPTLDAGAHTVYVQTQAPLPGEIENGFTYTKSSICRNADPDSDCQVDIDDNMIPVVYEGYDGNGGGNWRIVTKEEIENDKGSWYDYGNKQWANAITLRDDYEGGCFLVLTTGIVASQDSSGCSNPSIGTSTRYTPLGLAKAWRDGELSVLDAENLNATLFGSDAPDGIGAEGIILGYWVYIPRYAYEVQRRDAVDRVVDPQNFDIVFQTADEKNTPAPSCNSADKIWVNQPSGDHSTNNSNAGPNSSNVLAKDYRTGCWPNNRTYIANSSNTTWATNPAFSWGTEETGYTELNGIWVGKYETTGTRTAPTVKPNQHANTSEYIGEFYSAARSIGYPDPNNVGGGARTDDTTSGLTQNSHHLSKATSHMLKNSEWGAITYLAHSKYGAGINTSYTRDTNVNKNGAYPSSSADADGTSSRYGITGCGPVSAGSTSNYTDGTPLSADVIESPTACSTDPELGPKRAYNGELGVLSSTTNTIYGVYGLSGGASEYVMGNRTTSTAETSTAPSWPEVFTTPAKEPYVDLYVATPNGPFGANPSWSSSKSTEYLYNYDVCTFETCGGTATYETTTVQSVSSYYQSWGGSASDFVGSSIPWFDRGSTSNGSYASPFYAYYNSGYNNPNYGSRAALLALPDGQ